MEGRAFVEYHFYRGRLEVVIEKLFEQTTEKEAFCVLAGKEEADSVERIMYLHNSICVLLSCAILPLESIQQVEEKHLLLLEGILQRRIMSECVDR